MPTQGSVMRVSRQSDADMHVAASDDEEPPVIGATRISKVEALLRTRVFPKIASSHGLGSPEPSSRKKPKPIFTVREITRFADRAVAGNATALVETVSRAQHDGVALEDVWLELLQPAARLLGERWATDACDFVTVTLGLCQFHGLLRRYSPLFVSPLRPWQEPIHRVLLVPAAREQHTFGLVMLGEFLRREGCEVAFGPFASSTELASSVREAVFTIVGFSLSCDAGVDELASQIGTIRRASRNRNLTVLVGGRVFNERPELVSRVGADWTALDARQAVATVRGLARSKELNEGGRV